MKSAFSDFISGKKGIYGILHIIILIMSLFLVISISVDTFKGIPFYTQSSYMKVQLCICLWFLFDFVLEFFLAKHKGFIPLLRGGYALAIVVGWLTYNRASSLFVSYLTMLLATVYFSSLAFFVLEHRVNPLVNDYGDALWWAFMDVTTVGSNIIAQTVTGRVLSVLLAALGMMMFPIFTVYITNLIQQSNKRRKQYYEEEELEKKASEKKELAEKAAVQKASTS